MKANLIPGLVTILVPKVPNAYKVSKYYSTEKDIQNSPLQTTIEKLTLHYAKKYKDPMQTVLDEIKATNNNKIKVNIYHNGTSKPHWTDVHTDKKMVF